jgi:hypothetical protein
MLATLEFGQWETRRSMLVANKVRNINSAQLEEAILRVRCTRRLRG